MPVVEKSLWTRTPDKGTFYCPGAKDVVACGEIGELASVGTKNAESQGERRRQPLLDGKPLRKVLLTSPRRQSL